VAQHASNGGKACLDALSEISECARNPCEGPAPIDCRYGDWEQWSDCGKCSGERKRFRSITQYPQHGGKNCPPFDAEEAAACPRECHKKLFCTWNNWGPWSDCTMTCGTGGKRHRRRALHLSHDAGEQLPSPVSEIMAKYENLYEQTEEFETLHIQELVASFAGGCLSVMLVFITVRAIVSAKNRNAAFSSTDPESRSLFPASRRDHYSAWQGYDTQLPLFVGVE